MNLKPDDISIVVLTYNHYDFTHQLLMDIKQHCVGVHEVIVVDNASEDENVEQGLNFWLGLNVLPLKVVRLTKNRGFVGGMNYGIEKAEGKLVAIFSNDIRIHTSNFIQLILNNFWRDSKIILGAECYTHDTGWNQFGGNIYPYMSGHFLVATKQFWGQVGGFDTRYAPSDYEDVDLSTTALQMGYDLIELPKGIVTHLGGGTYGYTTERLARTRNNQAKFIEKWGVQV